MSDSVYNAVSNSSLSLVYSLSLSLSPSLPPSLSPVVDHVDGAAIAVHQFRCLLRDREHERVHPHVPLEALADIQHRRHLLLRHQCALEQNAVPQDDPELRGKVAHQHVVFLCKLRPRVLVVGLALHRLFPLVDRLGNTVTVKMIQDTVPVMLTTR